MDGKLRYQSCGMPLTTAGFYGTNADGYENRAYCKFCFQLGCFTNPKQTLEEMLQNSIEFMSKELKFSKGKAEKMSREVIPNLLGWRK